METHLNQEFVNIYYKKTMFFWVSDPGHRDVQSKIDCVHGDIKMSEGQIAI